LTTTIGESLTQSTSRTLALRCLTTMSYSKQELMHFWWAKRLWAFTSTTGRSSQSKWAHLQLVICFAYLIFCWNITRIICQSFPRL
jgi:hypothetical protein